MCGIYGWSFTPSLLPSREQRLILASVLGAMNERRGAHAWGAFPLKGSIIKEVGRVAAKASELAMFNDIMCHTRHATVGAPDKAENAHPFEIGNIIGAHNGSIYNHAELNNKFNRAHDVDSMHIFSHLDSMLPMRDLKGYGAIEFAQRDSQDGIFLGLLSLTGELSVFRTKYGVVWSSDEEHLDIACRASGMDKQAYFDMDPGEVIHIVRGKAYESTFDVEVSTESKYRGVGFTPYMLGDFVEPEDAFEQWWKNEGGGG